MSSAVWKRTLAGALAVLAFFAGVLAVRYTIQALEDFWTPAVPIRLAILGELLMSSMAFASLTIGIRLLRFSISGRSDHGSSWAKPVLLGIGFFFPAFLFSLPLTLLWARYTWPGDGQSPLAAMEVSCYVGVAAAAVCCVVLLKRRRHLEDRGTGGNVR